VIFLLLIFFAVSTTLVLHQKGIKLTLPSAETTVTEKKGLIIAIDKDQRIYIESQRYSEADLRQKIADELDKNPKLQVLLHADRLTPYSMIVRVLDEVRLGGCFDVVLEARKKIET